MSILDEKLDSAMLNAAVIIIDVFCRNYQSTHELMTEKIVDKEIREKLNKQFENLLAILRVK